jgi:hypothetical protein
MSVQHTHSVSVARSSLARRGGQLYQACAMLYCVETCCTELQHVVLRCNMLHCIAQIFASKATGLPAGPTGVETRAKTCVSVCAKGSAPPPVSSACRPAAAQQQRASNTGSVANVALFMFSTRNGVRFGLSISGSWLECAECNARVRLTRKRWSGGDALRARHRRRHQPFRNTAAVPSAQACAIIGCSTQTRPRVTKDNE